MLKWFNAFGKSNEIENNAKWNTKTKSSKLVSWVKTAIFAGMMATSSWAYAKNNTQEISYQNSFETGISFSMDTSDLQDVVGSNFRDMNDKIEIKNENISIKSSPNFNNTLRFAVEQKNGLRTIFEVWKDKKVIVKKDVAQADAASFIRAKKSIDDIWTDSNFKLNSANVSSDNSSASFRYKSTQVRATNSSVSADYDFSENTKLSASAGENNNTAGVEYKLWDNTKLQAKAWDKNSASVEHEFTQNVSGNISANEYGAAVWTRLTTDDRKTSLTLSSWESSQANFRTTTPKIFWQEAIINIWATYSNDTIGYNATLGQIFWDDFAYSLEASKRWEEQLFLIKSALKVQANIYLTAIYSSLKMSGLEYTYDEFLDANHISDLSFGELKEMYEMTQKTIGFGLSYVSGPNLISLNYYNSSADNVLFDDRINARYNPENKDIIITEKIQVAATGYSTQTIEAAYEYRLNDNFTFKGSVWYEMTQLKALYDLEEENLSNVRFSIGWEYTTNVFSVWNQDMRINTDVNYSNSEFNENFKTKLSFDFQDTWLARNGLYPYISYEKQDINGIKDDSIGFGISGTFGNTSRTKDIRDVMNQDHAPAEQFNGPLNRFAKYTTHLWDYFVQEGVAELRKSETVENAHDYVIYLGALNTTGDFISNIESVSDLIEVRDSQLIFKGINSGAFDSLAWQEFRLALELTNGNIYPLDIKTTKGSTNITLTAEKASDINGLSSDAGNTFVDEMSTLYTTSDVNFIKDNYYKNTISSNLISQIFAGNIFPEIISLGYIWGQMTLEALEFLASNLDTFDKDKQNDILELLNNWGQIDLDVLNATLNQAPTLSNITFGTLEDVSKEISYSEILAWANDKETPKDKLTLAKVAGVDFQGENTPDVELGLWTLSFWKSSMVFTPNDEVSGEQTFDIQVADEKGQLSNAATATVNIKNIDDNPEIILEDFDLDEDTKVIISRDQIISDIDTKLENVDLTVTSLDWKTIVQFLEKGDLEVSTADNENGDFSIALTVTQWDFTDTKNISGTIAPKNDAPEITDKISEFSVNETKVVKIDLLKHFYDIDKDDILSFVLPDWLDSNSFSLDGNILTVTNPWVNADVLNEFKITAVDLAGESAEKDFSFTFKNSVNEAPVWVADRFEMLQGESQLVDVLANDTDADGDTITISSISNAQNASLEIVDNKIKVTPNTNYFGPISFKYTPISNGVEWNVTTVSWNVIEVNDPTITAPDNLKIKEDSWTHEKDVLSNDSDADDVLTISSLDFDATKISASIVDNKIQVTTIQDVNGEFEIKYTTNTGSQETLTVTVDAVNDAPIAINTSANVLENSSNNTITLNISDVDGDDLTVLNPTALHGSVTVNSDNTLNYTPNAWITDPDTITYEVSDGELTDSATVTVNIWNVNDAPVATFNSFSTNEDTNYNGQLTATDLDEDTLSYWVKTSAQNGSVDINADGTFTYIPNENFNGTDTFEYEVSDGELTDTEVVTVTVNAVNDAPEATDLSSTFSINEWDSLEINLDNQIFDVDNEVLWFSVESGLDSWDYSIDGNMLTVTNLWVTQDTLKNVVIKGVDTEGLSGEKILPITFKNNVNENVEFSNFNPITSIAEWETKSFTFNYDDPNGDDVTLELKLGLNSAPDFATLVDHKDGSATVTFAPWYDDADTYMNFVVEAREPNGDRTSTAWFHLTVENTNTAPVASNFTSTSAWQSWTISKVWEFHPNISDVQEQDSSLTVKGLVWEVWKIATAVVNGSGWADWTAENNYEWNAKITYQVNDGFLDSNTATINVVADKKSPEYASDTIFADTQGKWYFNQTITVTDFSDLADADIQFVDLFTGDPVAGSIYNLRYSGKTVTFDFTTPNIENVRIIATFTDKYGNTSESQAIKDLSLSQEN